MIVLGFFGLKKYPISLKSFSAPVPVPAETKKESIAAPKKEQEPVPKLTRARNRQLYELLKIRDEKISEYEEEKGRPLNLFEKVNQLFPMPASEKEMGLIDPNLFEFWRSEDIAKVKPLIKKIAADLELQQISEPAKKEKQDVFSLLDSLMPSPEDILNSHPIKEPLAGLKTKKPRMS